MKKKRYYQKGRVLVVLLLFLCLSVLPCVGGTPETTIAKQNQKKIEIKDSFSEEKSTEEDGLLGFVRLRGWIFNPKKVGLNYHARAIRLRYTELSLSGINTGIIRLQKVTFRAGPFIRMQEFGVLGSFTHVSGFCFGGIKA
jgi:hypothetical protein